MKIGMKEEMGFADDKTWLVLGMPARSARFCALLRASARFCALLRATAREARTVSFASTFNLLEA